MLTEEQIQQIVAESTADIEDSAKRQVKDSVSHVVSRAVQDCIRECATAYLTEHVKPQIVAMLTEHNAAILEAATRVASEAGTLLVQAMVADFKKKLETSWTRKKILEAMFA